MIVQFISLVLFLIVLGICFALFPPTPVAVFGILGFGALGKWSDETY